MTVRRFKSGPATISHGKTPAILTSCPDFCFCLARMALKRRS
jgi:hypothetical protein